MSDSVYFTFEHQMLREQLRRFIDKEVVPHADAWEAEGATSRAVLREMGALGCPRSSGWPATPACSRSAAAPPK